MNRMTKEQRQAIAERLKSLEDKHGRLTPDIVVKDAKSSKSPLHDCFEWDLRKAAMQNWIETARELIVSIEYETSATTEYRAIPYYVRDPAAETNKQGYRSITSIMGNKEDARLFLIEEFKRVSFMFARAKSYAALLNM